MRRSEGGTTTGEALAAGHRMVDEFLAGDRRNHSLAVAQRAAELAKELEAGPRHMQIAGLIHDIGYGHPWRSTQHHAIDGWDFLTEHPILDLWAPDVLWHSTAVWEAEARGIRFPDVVAPQWPRRAILWIADFTTSPQGSPISLDRRLDDIAARHPRRSPVVRALKKSMPSLREAAAFCSVKFDG